MKIKDLDSKTSLNGLKVKTPEGVVGYWKSQWGTLAGKAGVWLTETPNNPQVYPQFLDKLSEAGEWEVATEKDKVNCHKR